MGRKKLIAVYLCIVAICLLSFSTRPPRARTGAPDELSCSAVGCHNINQEYDGVIQFGGFPAALVSGQTFEISVTLRATMGMPAIGGFQVVGLSRNDEGQLVNVGTFSEAEPGAIVSDFGGRNYLEHDGAKDFDGDEVSYFAKWTTPNTFPGDTVTLYAAAVLGNGNGQRTLDHVIFGSRAMPIANVVDNDNDGFNSDLDCDDNDPLINPNAQEIINNDVDEDCDGEAVVIDEDMDGFNSDDDCDDLDFNVKPSAVEIPNNDVDENCDGVILIIDDDNDGFNSDEDCDDNNPDINPGAAEIVNNDVDENCDGLTLIIDEDNDGFNSDEDCDDNDPNRNPGETDTLGNDIDENCDGVDGILAFSISSSVRNFRNEPIPDVAIIDLDTRDTLARTSSNGQFSFTSTDASLQIGFYKSARAAEGITATDLVLIANHITQRQVFANSLQPKSADVNGNGSVSATDLVLIKNVLLGRFTEFERPSWNFEPSSVTLDNNSTLSTIRAYKLGDVNASARE